jgi:hypothetical protein
MGRTVSPYSHVLESERDRWKPHSIGCAVGLAAEFEAKVMLEGLKQIRAVIGETERHIAEHCSEFPGIALF